MGADWYCIVSEVVVDLVQMTISPAPPRFTDSAHEHRDNHPTRTRRSD